MTIAPALLDQLQRRGAGLALRIISRDGLHLRPVLLSQAAARRLRAGLRALEAYVRRLLLVLALAFEPGLQSPLMARRVVRRKALSPPQSTGLRIFVGEGAWPYDWNRLPRYTRSPGPVMAAPLLGRLASLTALVMSPQGRARRLAFYLARRRPGLVLAPQLSQKPMPARFGTEVSALYDAMATHIVEVSRARPPPLGALARPPPRIRSL